MNRVLGRHVNRISEPWQMYPLGMLFGLGFDTATEIALLVLAAGAGASGLPFYAILCLPILFAAGMSLLDTIDGSFMNFAYGWAFSKPVRKVYYNITITGLSVAVALFIGTVELVGLLTDKLGLHGSLVDVVSELQYQHRWFRDRRDVRRHLDARPGHLALRQDRAEMDRRSGARQGADGWRAAGLTGVRRRTEPALAIH